MTDLLDKPADRDRIEVTLVGGPHHGLKMTVWRTLRRIEVPYAPEAEVPEVKEGERPAPVSLTTFTCIYARANEDADTATFADLELDA